MQQFNFDVLDSVFAHVVDHSTLSSLALSCRLFNEAATPHLYKSVVVRIRNDADKDPGIFETFRQRPELRLHVRCVNQIGPESYDSNEALKCDPTKEQWTHFLASLPNLQKYAFAPWSHWGFISQVRAHAALAALRQGARLSTISLRYEGVFSPSLLAFCFSSLRRIHLDMTLMEQANESQCAVLECCRQCPNLEHVGVVGLRLALFMPTSELSLTSFTLGPKYMTLQFEEIVSMMRYMPHLRDLDMCLYPRALLSPSSASFAELGFPHLRALTIRYIYSRTEIDSDSYSLSAMSHWIDLLLSHSRPEFLAVLSTGPDRRGRNGDVFVTRFAAATVERLKYLKMPYLRCSSHVLQTLLAFCPNLEELSIAVDAAQSLAPFREPRFLCTPPLHTIMLHSWIPKGQAQADNMFVRSLLQERSPHLVTFIVDGKQKWQSRWVIDRNSSGVFRRDISGPVPCVVDES